MQARLHNKRAKELIEVAVRRVSGALDACLRRCFGERLQGSALRRNQPRRVIGGPG